MPNAEIQEILVEIEEKKKKADELATEFRRLYQESQEAYQDGNGELAKELSIQGHEAQDECKALNEEVTDLYEELRDLRRQAAEIGDLPQTVLQRMPVSFQKVATDTLNALPSRHVSGKLIERVSYSDEYIIGSSGNPIQANTHFDQVGNKPVIVLNKQTPDGFTNTESLQVAVAHEVGHVVYEMILSNEERADWFAVMNEIYAQLDNPDEDAEANKEEFARAYSRYFFDKDELKEKFPEEYEFFESLDF